MFVVKTLQQPGHPSLQSMVQITKLSCCQCMTKIISTASMCSSAQSSSMKTQLAAFFIISGKTCFVEAESGFDPTVRIKRDRFVMSEKLLPIICQGMLMLTPRPLPNTPLDICKNCHWTNFQIVKIVQLRNNVQTQAASSVFFVHDLENVLI